MDRHITLFRSDDAPPIDSHDSSGTLQQSETRTPEVIKAGRIGHATARRARTPNDEEQLWVARKLPDTLAMPLGSGILRLSAPAAELRASSAELRNILIAVGVLLLGAVAGVTVPLARRITGQLSDMANTARLITRGALSERASVRSEDELGMLAAALNEMAQKLNTDIEKLQKLERVRSEFLGNVSHELRTPIFAIQGFLETLLDGAIDDPAVNRDFLEKAHRHAERLNALLHDLIEISRIESGEMKMSFRYLDVRAFLQAMTEEMRGKAEQKNITLTFTGDGGGNDEAYGDRERLRQVMVNLIDNAIKYTDAGGRVGISCRPAADRCEISVQDTGCGIPREHLSRIFERFYRVDRDRSRDVGGTGLGLAIVKHIVEAHGGTMRVESVVGEGSTFTFSLKQ